MNCRNFTKILIIVLTLALVSCMLALVGCMFTFVTEVFNADAASISNTDFIESELINLHNTLKLVLSSGAVGNPAPPKLLSDNDPLLEYEIINLGRWYGTAYNNVPEQTDDTPDITASGRRIVLGYSIAVDPAYWRTAIKEGWLFWIEGIGICRADDTGSKIKGQHRFDLAVATKSMAYTVTGYRQVWLLKPKSD